MSHEGTIERLQCELTQRPTMEDVEGLVQEIQHDYCDDISIYAVGVLLDNFKSKYQPRRNASPATPDKQDGAGDKPEHVEGEHCNDLFDYTGEYRHPAVGEYYVNECGGILKWQLRFGNKVEYWILRPRTKAEFAVGDKVMVEGEITLEWMDGFKCVTMGQTHAWLREDQLTKAEG